MSPRYATVAGVTAVAALVGAGAATRPSTAGAGTSPSVATRPVGRVQLVCPGLHGSSPAPAQISVVDAGRLLDPSGAPAVRVTMSPLAVGDAAAGPVTALSAAPAVTTTFAAALPTTVVTAEGPGAGNVAAAQHQLVPTGTARGLISAPCLPAVTDSWITGADGRVGHNDALVLANPGSTDAEVTATAWSVNGPVDLPGLESLSVPSGHAVSLSVANYAPDAGLVSLHIHADAGRVAAEVGDNQVAGLSPAGTDWLPPTLPPSTHLVVSGYSAGPGPRLLVVTNPGHDDATVKLRLLTADRAFVPSDHPDVVVPPGRSALVDLSTSLGGAAAAAELTSDRPVVAAGMSQLTSPGGLPDVAWHPATGALTGPAVLAENAPALGAGGQLALTAVGGPATVRLVGTSGGSRTVQIAADRAVGVDLRAVLGAGGSGPVVIVPVSGEVWASRSITANGAHGPLLTAIVPSALPAPLRLPDVVEDPRVALR
ncbi:MAG TPA: DUF5719 family protein [Mycobacteriales bacterium]|nr:DUF5719 family protein [Mycobacteriales bacterium]